MIGPRSGMALAQVADGGIYISTGVLIVILLVVIAVILLRR